MKQFDRANIDFQSDLFYIFACDEAHNTIQYGMVGGVYDISGSMLLTFILLNCLINGG